MFVPATGSRSKRSASKNLSIYNPKIVSKLSEILSGMFIPDPDLVFLPIPDPGLMGQKAPDHESGSATPRRT
jgi:hypothetical protein